MMSQQISTEITEAAEYTENVIRSELLFSVLSVCTPCSLC